MPGLVAMVSALSGGTCTEKLEVMAKAMNREPWYECGHYADPMMHTYAAWTSHGSPEKGSMPFMNETNDVALILTGEVFSQSSHYDQLRARGHLFNSGDYSHLVHLYEELGDRFFLELNGWFGGVLVDRKRQRTFVFNDRYGMHRLFYWEGPDGVYLASEAKALLAASPALRQFDAQGLCEFVTCGCTIGSHSLYKDVEVLPGASLVEFGGGALHKKSVYFDRAPWENQERLPGDQFISEFASTLPKVVRRYFSSDSPVGMSLTGGLDSRMVLGCYGPPEGSVRCYTFGMPVRETFDVKVARRVAQRAAQPHEVIEVGDEFVAELGSYLEKAVFISDGYLGLSGAAELYANSRARTLAPVRVTGNYGSELLRHARAFKFRVPRDGILGPELSTLAERVRQTFEKMNGIRDVSYVAFHQAPNQGYGRLAIERSQLELRTPFLDNQLMELLYHSPDSCDGLAVAGAAICRCNHDLSEIPTDRGYLGRGPSTLRALRRAYRQGLFKAEYWTGRGAPDWLVRFERMHRWLRIQDMFLGTHKYYDLRPWLAGPLKAYVRDMFHDDGLEQLWCYFDRAATLRMAEDHFLEKRNRADELDTVLTAALTCRLLLQ